MKLAETPTEETLSGIPGGGELVLGSGHRLLDLTTITSGVRELKISVREAKGISECN